MKNYILAMILLLSTTGILLNAQDRPRQTPEDRASFDRFRSMKIAYYSERIEFTPEEAEAFWPVYNEFEMQNADLNRQSRDQFRDFESNIETMSEQQAEKMIDQYIELQKKQAQLAADFHARFKKILPPQKIMKLYITEVQFREYMLRRLREDRGDDRGNPPARRPPPQNP